PQTRHGSCGWTKKHSRRCTTSFAMAGDVGTAVDADRTVGGPRGLRAGAPTGAEGDQPTTDRPPDHPGAQGSPRLQEERNPLDPPDRHVRGWLRGHLPARCFPGPQRDWELRVADEAMAALFRVIKRGRRKPRARPRVTTYPSSNDKPMDG